MNASNVETILKTPPHWAQGGASFWMLDRFNGGNAWRRGATIATPIVIEKGVWSAASATIIGGVTVGENSVVAL